MKFIRELSQLSRNDVKVAGGKGAMLGELINNGMNVPDGFVLLANAFDKFVKLGGLKSKIDLLLKDIKRADVKDIKNRSNKIRKLFDRTSMPEEIGDEILKEFKKLRLKSVAVRSSALVEDALHASWSGQMESYLGVNESELLYKIKKCWGSIFSQKALNYRINKSLGLGKWSMAVVVQRLVNADISGVIFTTHPVTNDKDLMVVEAAEGMGENIVGGKVTPSRYLVNKKYNLVLEDNFEKKQGKNKKWLTYEQVIEVAKVAKKIEKIFVKPQDIEWLILADKLFILQSRPITTIGDNKKPISATYDYIKSQKWFMGIRAEESLFFYSAKQYGFNKYMLEIYAAKFADNILVNIKKNYPIRVFNLMQAKIFHTISDKKILERPQILGDYIKKGELIWLNIDKLSNELLQKVAEKKVREAIKLFKKITNKYAMVSAYNMVIFSLGMRMAENFTELKRVEYLRKQHDGWRNGMVFKEEKMGKSIYDFLSLMVSEKKGKIDPLDIMKYLTLTEVTLWLDGIKTNSEIINLIKKRKKYGYVYINLSGIKKEFVEKKVEVTKIRKYFRKMDGKMIVQEKNGRIQGQVAYKLKNKVCGKVVVVKDKSQFVNQKASWKNKILVTRQTTPHFIAFLKGVKAIITDEGGITCHAAILARELKVPTIVGTHVATRKFKNDDLVEMDMERGEINILKKVT